MRCVGADNPPCARCHKANRTCIVPQPDGTRSTRIDAGSSASNTDRVGLSMPSNGAAAMNSSSIMPDGVLSATPPCLAYGKTPDKEPESMRSDSDSHEISRLPSIYSASPMTTVGSQTSPRSTSARVDNNTDLSGMRSLPIDQDFDSTTGHVDDQELSHMIHL